MPIENQKRDICLFRVLLHALWGCCLPGALKLPHPECCQEYKRIKKGLFPVCPSVSQLLPAWLWCLQKSASGNPWFQTFLKALLFPGDFYSGILRRLFLHSLLPKSSRQGRIESYQGWKNTCSWPLPRRIFYPHTRWGNQIPGSPWSRGHNRK